MTETTEQPTPVETQRRTVWAVTDVDDYDSGILFVCDTRHRAELSVAMLRNARGYQGVQVEEVEYRDTDPVLVNMYERSVAIHDDGRVTDEGEASYQEWVADPLGTGPPVARWSWTREWLGLIAGGRLRAWGTDPERVTQVFTEQRARFLADATYRSESRSG